MRQALGVPRSAVQCHRSLRSRSRSSSHVMRIGKKSAEPLAVNLYHLNAERIGVSLFAGKHDGDEHNMERRWSNRTSMNAEHWIMRAAPEALAGVGNRARVI